jgi:hypothetical protein
MMEGGSVGSKEENLKRLLMQCCHASEGVRPSSWSDCRVARLKLYNRSMKLSEEQLTEEATRTIGEKYSVLHEAAGPIYLPLDAINRLVDALGVDCKDCDGRTVIMLAAAWGRYDIIEYLARNKSADLSIIDRDGDNVYALVGKAPGIVLPQTRKEKTYRVLRESGVTGATIIKGFRSPLSRINDSLLLPKRLAQELDGTRFYIRALTIRMEELQVEAKEPCDNHAPGEVPLIFAARCVQMEAVFGRLQRAWPGSVNVQDMIVSSTALMASAFLGHVEHVRPLATMGTDLAIVDNDGDNVFRLVELSSQSSESKAVVFRALAEHGVTSSNIPPGFQSSLYFRSIYYQENVRTQRWLNRSPLILSANRLYNWSVENQVESEFHRTLPANLSGVGHFVAHCFFDVGGGSPDNGIARLITQFYGGFDESRAKSPFALIGMPEYGKLPDTATRCSNCRVQAKTGKKWLRCCGKVGYCSKECQLADWKRGHKKSCERNKNNGSNVKAASDGGSGGGGGKKG